MPKCAGVIGYTLSEETQPGVWSETITEKTYFGELVRDNRKVEQGEINASINISNNISILSNSFMLQNLSFMRYITFMNSKWKISSVEIKAPRIVITLGGLFNG